MSADSELSSILNHRQQINDALENGETVKHTFKTVNIYTEFHEFSRKEIKNYQQTFNKWVRFYIFCYEYKWVCEEWKKKKRKESVYANVIVMTCEPVTLWRTSCNHSMTERIARYPWPFGGRQFRCYFSSALDTVRVYVCRCMRAGPFRLYFTFTVFARCPTCDFSAVWNNCNFCTILWVESTLFSILTDFMSVIFTFNCLSKKPHNRFHFLLLPSISFDCSEACAPYTRIISLSSKYKQFSHTFFAIELVSFPFIWYLFFLALDMCLIAKW